MSLRGFHIVFIVLAALSDIFVWMWTRTNVDAVEEMNIGWLRAASGWLAIAIIGYGFWFIIKKARTIIV